MVTQEIREIIKRFVEVVLSRGIHVDKAILYGSYAAGKEGKDSDLDVALVHEIKTHGVEVHCFQHA